MIGVGRVLRTPTTGTHCPYGWLGISSRIPSANAAGATKPVGMLAGSAIIFFAYIGFDSVSTHAEEAKNPQRDVPIGIVTRW